tara:strand:+ start:979 stop:1773 length:795 start_codon:yes stop_codon:yes gene_type:complete
MFFGCEDVIDIEVSSSESKLIIDAIFEVYHNHTPVTANTVVKLRESTNYFDDEIPAITNPATVLLKDLTNDIDIIFEDNNSDGNFLPVNPFIPIENVDYELNIFYNEDLYQSQSKLITTTGFSEVYQGNSTLFTGEEIEVNVSFIDDVNTENNYLFNFSNDLFLPIQDRFFNGSTYNFSFFYQEDEVEIPSTVLIKMSGVTKEYLTYFNVLISQSGQQAGGPFETIPSSLLGNIVNTTNNKNFPLGYFHISETDTYNLSLIEID